MDFQMFSKIYSFSLGFKNQCTENKDGDSHQHPRQPPRPPQGLRSERPMESPRGRQGGRRGVSAACNKSSKTKKINN